MTIKCPNGCKGNNFFVNVRECHDWKVDKNGNFLEDVGCIDSDSSGADYFCEKCGTMASVDFTDSKK